MQIKYIAINDILSICDKIAFKIIFNKVNLFNISLLIFNFLDIFSSCNFFSVICKVTLLSVNFFSSSLIIYSSLFLFLSVSSSII